MTPGWSIGNNFTISSRWDSTVVAPTTGALKVSEKHSGTWTHGTATNYDGNFALGTSIRLGYSNGYPFWIKNILFYDEWIADTTSAFTFTDVTSADRSTLYVSNSVTYNGLTGAISITGGEYSINAGTYTNVAGTVYPGDTVTVDRHTSSALFNTATKTVLTMGGVSDTYTTTTLLEDLVPDPFTFVDVTGATLNIYYY